MRSRLQQAVLWLTGFICIAVGALWAALLLMSALFGLSAMPDDAATTQTLIKQLLEWLVKQDPTLASFTAAGFVFLLGLFVLGYAWSRSFPHMESRPLLADKTTSDTTVTGTRAHHDVNLSQAIATWRNMVDAFEKAYKANRRVRIEDYLTNNPEYYRLEQYLSRDTLDALRAVSAGIKIRPALMIRGEETPEQTVISKLKQDIARMERAVSIPIEERRRIIAEAYSMIEVVEEQCQRRELEENITSLIRRKREYQRIDLYLCQSTRNMFDPHSRIVEASNGGTIEERVIERLRRDLADLERQWGLA